MPTPHPVNEDAASLQTMRPLLDHLDRSAVAAVERTQGSPALAWMERQTALTEEVRAALIKTGRDASAPGSAATIMVNFPNHWREYRDRDGSPELNAYIAALEEIADPAVWAARLRTQAKRLIDNAAYKLRGGNEHLGRMTWASADPDLLMTATLGCAEGAIADIAAAQRLFAEADRRERGEG